MQSKKKGGQMYAKALGISDCVILSESVECSNDMFVGFIISILYIFIFSKNVLLL